VTITSMQLVNEGVAWISLHLEDSYVISVTLSHFGKDGTSRSDAEGWHKGRVALHYGCPTICQML